MHTFTTFTKAFIIPLQDGEAFMRVQNLSSQSFSKLSSQLTRFKAFEINFSTLYPVYFIIKVLLLISLSLMVPFSYFSFFCGPSGKQFIRI